MRSAALAARPLTAEEARAEYGRRRDLFPSVWLVGLAWDIPQELLAAPPRGWDTPGCCGPSFSSWHICSKARHGCGLRSFVHIKRCHLAAGNLPNAVLSRVGLNTATGWPQQCLIGKRGSELSGGSEAV